VVLPGPHPGILAWNLGRISTGAALKGHRTALRALFWAIIIAILTMLGWLSKAIEWLNLQPAGTQGLVLLILGVLIAGGGGLLSWIARSVYARYRQGSLRKQEQRSSAEIAMRADFLKGNVAAGTTDHAVNVNAAPYRLADLNKRAVPLVLAIEHEIVETSKRFPPMGSTDYFKEKQSIESELAKAIHPSVVEIEDIAAEFKSQTKLYIDGYRALIPALPVHGKADIEILHRLPAGFSGEFADVFKLAADTYRTRRQFMGKMQGHQQDLSRMAARQAASLKVIAECSERIYSFCAVELKRLVDAKVRKHQ
jgi:hypothetical protein